MHIAWKKQSMAKKIVFLFACKTFAFMAFVCTILSPRIEDGRKENFSGGKYDDDFPRFNSLGITGDLVRARAVGNVELGASVLLGHSRAGQHMAAGCSFAGTLNHLTKSWCVLRGVEITVCTHWPCGQSCREAQGSSTGEFSDQTAQLLACLCQSFRTLMCLRQQTPETAELILAGWKLTIES